MRCINVIGIELWTRCDRRGVCARPPYATYSMFVDEGEGAVSLTSRNNPSS